MFTRDVLKDHNAPAFALLSAVIKAEGLSALEIDPSILRTHLEETYDVKLTDLQSDKIQAAMVVATTDLYEHCWVTFEKVNHILCNHADDFDTLNPLEAEELIVGLSEATLIKHSFHDEGQAWDFSDEVRAYAGRIFHNYGMSKAPKLFPSALMPTSVPCDNKAKNEALKELFDVHAQHVVEYLEKL